MSDSSDNPSSSHIDSSTNSNYIYTPVLSDDDISHFMEYGYTLLPQAFSHETASACRDILWHEIESQSSHHITRDNPSSWDEYSKVAMDRTCWPEDGSPWKEVFTDRLYSAIQQLCSSSSSSKTPSSSSFSPPPPPYHFGAGWWMITFPKPPLCTECDIINPEQWTVEGAWHIDGHNHPRHIYDHDIGIILVMYFSDVLPDYGGTAVLEASHLRAIHHIMQCGYRGIHKKDLVHGIITESNYHYDITELTGSAGDVFLLHPLLIHARSSNYASYDDTGVRFMCHPSIALQDSLRFNQPIEDMSVLEKIVHYECEKHQILEHLYMITPASVEAFHKKRYDDKNNSHDDDVEDDDAGYNDDMMASLIQKFETHAHKRSRIK